MFIMIPYQRLKKVFNYKVYNLILEHDVIFHFMLCKSRGDIQMTKNIKTE